jgi:hypothetical protein
MGNREIDNLWMGKVTWGMFRWEMANGQWAPIVHSPLSIGVVRLAITHCPSALSDCRLPIVHRRCPIADYPLSIGVVRLPIIHCPSGLSIADVFAIADYRLQIIDELFRSMHPLEAAGGEPGEDRAGEDQGHQHQGAGPRLTMPVVVRRDRISENLDRERPHRFGQAG